MNIKRFIAPIATAVAALIWMPAPSIKEKRSIDEFLASPDARPKTTSYSCVRRSINNSPPGMWEHNLTTDTAAGYTNRRDFQSKALGQGPSMAFATAQGTATAASATSLTNSGAAFPTAGQGLAGSIVVAVAATSGLLVYAVIVSNTSTVLTVDQWYDPTSTSGAASANIASATAKYVILPGQNPASWLAVTSDAVAPASSDTTLASEATTNGFARAVGSYSHSAAASTYALAHTFTATGSLTVNKEAVFGACNTTAGGVMPYESAEPTPPALLSGDTLAQTITISI